MTKNATSANGEAMPVSRRYLLGATLAGTALSVDAFVSAAAGIAGAQDEPDPADRIDQMARDLSAALSAEYGGDFECTIGPDGAISYSWGLPIVALFARWRAAADAANTATTEAEAQRHMAEYFRLQDAIVTTAPASAREAAIQFIVETDNGDSDFSDDFLRRTRSLAWEG